MSNYSNLPWGFAPSTQHIIKEEPPNAHPRRCVVLFICCTSLTIPQSAYADSSLYTREPWGVSSKGMILQNLEPSLM